MTSTHDASKPAIHADVLIVGAGPVGLTAALLLTRLGMSVEIIERREGPQRSPAAHVVSARSFEIWRQAGVDVERLRTLAQSPTDAGHVHWVTKLGGEVIGSLPFEQQGDDVLAITPTPLRNLSQHKLEPALVEELRALEIEVNYSTQWRASSEHADCVTSVVTTDGIERSITSRWLLACDGASSPVRRSLGIEPIGPHNIQTFLMVHLAANFRHLVSNNPGVLFWVCDPRSAGTFVAHDIDNESVFMHPLAADADGDAATYSVDHCTQLVRNAIADVGVDFEVLSISTWVMTAQIATQYRTGRAFLVGDAAHRFPPTGGLGLNTGVQDAHNLAWKIAAVTQGTANATLLDTYESERRPVAERNCEVSLENAFKLIEVPLALGADHDLEVATANLEQALRYPERRSAVSAAIEHQATHFDMLGLQLGYEYGGGNHGDIRVYAPSGVPGARLPHAWITHNGAACSTLDLVPLDRHVTIGGPTCAREVDLRIGADIGDAALWWSTTLGLPEDGWIVVRPDQHIAERSHRDRK